MLTPRLALAAVGLDDVDDLVQLYADPEVGRWTGPWNRASVQDWAHSMSVRWAEDGVGKWMAYERATGSLVGRGGFTRIVLEAEPVLELGWVIHDALTGHGYATELGRAALDWAAQHWPALPIVAFTELHNYASRAVMERLGMLFTRVIWREGLMEGHLGLHPDAPFALYRG